MFKFEKQCFQFCSFLLSGHLCVCLGGALPNLTSTAPAWSVVFVTTTSGHISRPHVRLAVIAFALLEIESLFVRVQPRMYVCTVPSLYHLSLSLLLSSTELCATVHDESRKT